MKTENHKPFISAIIISICTILSRLTGMVRAMIMASFLGTGVIADALYVAIKLPNTFRRIFAEGAFSNAFIPFFSSKVKENKNVANIFSLKVLKILIISLILLTLIIEIFMPSVVKIINPGFISDAYKFDLTVKLSRICFPYVILISLASFFGSILNSIGHFWQYASVSVLLNIVIIGGLFLTNQFFTHAGYCVSWLLVLTGIVQTIFVAMFCCKYSVFPKNSKNIIDKHIEENRIDVKNFIKKLIPAIISSGILQINIFIDGIFASFFAGAVSFLYYTDRMVNFPLSIIGYSLSVAILPSLSIAFKQKKIDAIKDLQTKTINIAIFFSFPAMLIFCILSKPIIAIIYERGAFTASDTRIIASMLTIYAISIPFNVLIKIFFSCFYSQKNTKTPMQIGLFSLIFNIISNLILFKIVNMYCVIISTTTSAILSCLLAIILLKKNNNLYVKFSELKFSLKVILISILSFGITPFALKDFNIFIILIICGTIHLALCLTTNIINREFLKSLFQKQIKL